MKQLLMSNHPPSPGFPEAALQLLLLFASLFLESSAQRSDSCAKLRVSSIGQPCTVGSNNSANVPFSIAFSTWTCTQEEDHIRMSNETEDLNLRVIKNFIDEKSAKKSPYYILFLGKDESDIVVDEEIIDRPFHGGGAVLVFVDRDDGENAAANGGVGAVKKAEKKTLGDHYLQHPPLMTPESGSPPGTTLILVPLREPALASSVATSDFLQMIV
nr:hypothetical protein Iba_chr10eCG14480 [Ipomoea batatas]